MLTVVGKRRGGEERGNREGEERREKGAAESGEKEAEGRRPQEMVFKDTWVSHLWDESLLTKPCFYFYHQIRDHVSSF